MSAFGIGLLIFIGLLLILLEILVIPGVGIAGIGGIVLMAFGVYLAYANYGMQTGSYVLAGTAIFIVGALYFVLKAKTWQKLSLNSEIDSKVNLIDEENIKVGDAGVTISRLTPIGKVLINNQYVEARSKGSYIDPETNVKVIRITDNKIFVDEVEQEDEEED